MNDLFKKINTLVNAKLHGALDDARSSVSRRVRLRPSDKSFDRQIKALRDRLDEAFVYEEQLQKRIHALHGEVTRLDQLADDAVRKGDDANARQFIARRLRAQQRLDMLKADLKEHQLLSQDMLRQINALEAALADARYAEQQAAESAPSGVEAPGRTVRVPKERSLDGVMEAAQQRIGELGELMSTQKDRLSTFIQGGPTKAEVDEAIQQANIDDELEARRKRLSQR